MGQTLLRIKFSVSVVSTEAEQEHERFITFGDDVPVNKAKDFFYRSGEAVEQLFATVTQHVTVLMNGAWNSSHKIALIKLIREYVAGFGLKEAKDHVERAIMLCEQGAAEVPLLTLTDSLSEGFARDCASNPISGPMAGIIVRTASRDELNDVSIPHVTAKSRNP